MAGTAAWDGRQYDQVSAPQFRWGSEVLARLGDLEAWTVLDAGCGSGRVTEALLEAGPDLRVVALDASSSMLDEARERLERFADRVTFVHADLDGDFGAALRAASPFDAVLSTGTFHWVHDHAQMYRRLYALLRPGGRLVAQCGGAGSVGPVRAILDELGVEWRSFNVYAGADQSEEWLRAAGFTDVWTWLHDEPAEFRDRAALVDYLAGGVLAPYLAAFPEPKRDEVAELVADRLGELGELGVPFVRLNILARRPDGETTGVRS
jgi:trans-aconitate 2-methyltransferase